MGSIPATPAIKLGFELNNKAEANQKVNPLIYSQNKEKTEFLKTLSFIINKLNKTQPLLLTEILDILAEDLFTFAEITNSKLNLKNKKELIKFLQFLYSTVLSSNQTDEYLDLFNLSISTAYELLAS